MYGYGGMGAAWILVPNWSTIKSGMSLIMIQRKKGGSCTTTEHFCIISVQIFNNLQYAFLPKVF